MPLAKAEAFQLFTSESFQREQIVTSLHLQPVVEALQSDASQKPMELSFVISRCLTSGNNGFFESSMLSCKSLSKSRCRPYLIVRASRAPLLSIQ